MATMKNLNAQMMEALEKGDNKAITQIARAINALATEVEKGKKAELSAKHDEVSDKVLKVLDKALRPLWKDLEEVGVTSIPIKVEGHTVGPVKGSKFRKGGGGGGGGAGKTKAEYGQSLGEIFTAHATPEEVAEHDGAPDGNKKYAVKVRVKKRAIKDGLLTPA